MAKWVAILRCSMGLDLLDLDLLPDLLLDLDLLLGDRPRVRVGKQLVPVARRDHVVAGADTCRQA